MMEAPTFKGMLLDHQRKGIKWMLDMEAKGLGQILADGPGLGKSVSLHSLLVLGKKIRLRP
jgi:SNF2 family DNA or RNA helicase